METRLADVHSGKSANKWVERVRVRAMAMVTVLWLGSMVGWCFHVAKQWHHNMGISDALNISRNIVDINSLINLLV